MPRPNRGVRLSDKPNGRGHYEILWPVAARAPGGKGNTGRHSTGKASREEAELYFARWRLEQEREQEALDGPVIPTVAEVLKAYREGHIAENELAKSRENWDRCAAYVQHSPLGRQLATEVTPLDVKEYGRRRQAGLVGFVGEDGERHGFKPGGLACHRNEMAALNAAMRWCVENRIYSGLTLASLHPVKAPPPAEPRDHWWTIPQADAMLAAAKARSPNGFDRLYLFVLICLDTASRKEALETLTWDRVKLWRDDAGAWQGEIDFVVPGRRKTKKRRGLNSLSTATAAILADARTVRRNDLVLGDDTDIDAVFRRLAEKVTGKGEGAHILRHSWATWAAAAGVSLWDIAGVLHDTIATVEKHYAKHQPANRLNAVNTVAALRALPANDAGTGSAEAVNGGGTAGVSGGVTPTAGVDLLSTACLRQGAAQG